jgi:hypothetical protein
MLWIGILLGIPLGVTLFMLLVVLCGAADERDSRHKIITYGDR